MRPLIRITHSCAMAGAIAGLLAGLVIGQPAGAATTPTAPTSPTKDETAGPSTQSLGNAEHKVQSAQEQLASAEQEVRDATSQLQGLSYQVVTLHNEQSAAQVALASARVDTRKAIRSAYEAATVDPTATLLADLSGNDPGLDDQVRDHRMKDLGVRTKALQAAADKLDAVSQDTAQRSVEAAKAAARAVSAADRARTGLITAQQTDADLHQAAELASQRKELDMLNKELEASLASIAAAAAGAEIGAGSSGIGVTASAPADLISLYQKAAKTCPGLPWGVLAAIGQVETGHGRNKKVSSAGAMGPMQFLPATFVVYGVDGDGDGIKDILDQADAVFSAARYLCANGGGQTPTLYNAIYHYNHLNSYARLVLSLAAQYAAGAQPS